MLNRKIKEELEFIPIFDDAVSEKWQKKGADYIDYLLKNGSAPDGFLKPDSKPTIFKLRPLTAEQFDLVKSCSGLERERTAIKYGVVDVQNYQVNGKPYKFSFEDTGYGRAMTKEGVDELGFILALRSSLMNMIENITYSFEL